MKLSKFIFACLFVLYGCDKYDDTDILNDIRALKEELSSMKMLITKLQTSPTISSVAPNDNGFAIAFSDGQTYNIINGATPIISIGNDGYWTINGHTTEFYALGKDGKDGEDGEDGKDGITPTIAISQDNTWIINGNDTGIKASGNDGKDCPHVKSVMFDGVNFIFNFSDNTTITCKSTKYTAPNIVNYKTDIRKTQLRILNIGSSFTLDAIAYLQNFVNNAEITTDDISIYTVTRGVGKYMNWVNIYRGKDLGEYRIRRNVGKKINEVKEKLYSKLDDTGFKELLSVQWDLIIINQANTYSNNFDIWEGYTQGGYLREFIRLLKATQPQAEIGYLMVHSSNNLSEGNTVARWEEIVETTKKFSLAYDINFIIPVGTAIENIRASKLNTSSHNLSRDDNHLGHGLARYVAAATYYHAIFGTRYGKTVLGNKARIAVTDNMKSDCKEEYYGDLIDITDDNAYTAQMAAVLACSNMYEIQNPDGVTL